VNSNYLRWGEDGTAQGGSALVLLLDLLPPGPYMSLLVLKLLVSSLMVVLPRSEPTLLLKRHAWQSWVAETAWMVD